MRGLAAAALLMFVAAPAAALDPIPGEDTFKALLEPTDKTSAGGGLTFGKINEDWFLTITPRFDLNLGPFGIGLQAPLNIRLIDEPAKVPTGGFNIEPLRTEDWDEPTEFLRAIRYVRWGNKRDFIYARVGELVADIGHGTIMSRYQNNTNTNTFHLGLQLDVNTAWAGVESVISDVGMFAGDYVDARLVGGRVYIKPVAFWDSTSFLNMFQIGGTVIIDENAPWALQTENNPIWHGPALPGQTIPQRATLDSTGRYVVSERRSAVVWGLDAEAEVLNNSWLELIPYVDLNFVRDGDAGFHAGVNFKFKFPLFIELQIPAKLEYRFFGPEYLPAYFDAFYEIERYNYPSTSIAGVDGVPKSRYLRSRGPGGGHSGIHGEAAADIGGYVQVGAVYEAAEGSPGNLQLYVAVPAVDWLEVKAYYARTNIQGPDDIFGLDERSIMVAQIRYEVISYVYAVARYSRHWSRQPQSGNVVGADDFKFGVEFAYDF